MGKTTSGRDRAAVGGHAVVLGASLAGLAAAGTLAARFDRVTVVDRDTMPTAARPRRGVPQGRHAHLLLPSGLTQLAELFPGLGDDLRRRGAHLIPANEFRFYAAGGRLRLDESQLAISGSTRPLIEGSFVSASAGSTTSGCSTDARPVGPPPPATGESPGSGSTHRTTWGRSSTSRPTSSLTPPAGARGHRGG